MMELAKSHDESEFDQNKGNLRATGESKISNNPQSPELQELMDVILAENKITERAGFNLPSFCNLVKNLYLALNTNENKDLDSLVSLLSQHDFLLS